MINSLHLGSLWMETTVVGIVCIIFLILFVVAGIRQIYQNQEEDNG